MEMAKNYYTLYQAFEMVAADSDSGSEPEYSEPKFSDSDDDMGHVQPPLQNVQSSRNSNNIYNKISHLTNMSMRKLQFFMRG